MRILQFKEENEINNIIGVFKEIEDINPEFKPLSYLIEREIPPVDESVDVSLRGSNILFFFLNDRPGSDLYNPDLRPMFFSITWDENVLHKIKPDDNGDWSGFDNAFIEHVKSMGQPQVRVNGVLDETLNFVHENAYILCVDHILFQ